MSSTRVPMFWRNMLLMQVSLLFVPSKTIPLQCWYLPTNYMTLLPWKLWSWLTTVRTSSFTSFKWLVQILYISISHIVCSYPIRHGKITKDPRIFIHVNIVCPISRFDNTFSPTVRNDCGQHLFTHSGNTQSHNISRTPWDKGRQPPRQRKITPTTRKYTANTHPENIEYHPPLPTCNSPPYMFRPPQERLAPPHIEAHTIQPIDHAHQEANQDTATHRTSAGI